VRRGSDDFREIFGQLECASLLSVVGVNPLWMGMAPECFVRYGERCSTCCQGKSVHSRVTGVQTMRVTGIGVLNPFSGELNTSCSAFRIEIERIRAKESEPRET